MKKTVRKGDHSGRGQANYLSDNDDFWNVSVRAFPSVSVRFGLVFVNVSVSVYRFATSGRNENAETPPKRSNKQWQIVAITSASASKAATRSRGKRR